MKIIRLITLCFLVFSSMSLHAEYFRKIGLGQGLTQPSVFSIGQDQLGRMWFGTSEGLNIYNGESVTAYKGWVQSADSLIWLGNQITTIKSDNKNCMYFISDFNLMRYDVKLDLFYRLTNDSQVESMDSFEGQIWYTKNDSLFSIGAEKDAPKFYTKFNINQHIEDLIVTKEKIYLAHRNGLCVVELATKSQRNYLEGINVQYLFESSKKELWIGTNMHGMYWIDPDGELHQVPFLPDSPKGIKSHRIRQFVEDDNHNVWFGSFDGLHKYDVQKDEYQLIKIPQNIGGLTHSSVYSLFKDSQGIIWVGTYWGGVNYFQPGKDNYVFYEYDIAKNENLYFSYLGDMTLDKNGNLWLCTDGGGVTCMNDKWEIIHSFTSNRANSVLHNNIKGIAYDAENDCMYIATFLGGLSRYDLRTNKFFNYLTEYKSSGAVPNLIVNFIKILNGKVYLMADNGFFILDIKTQKFEQVSLPSDLRLGFDIDENGNLYLMGWNSFAYLNISNPQNITRVDLRHIGCYSTLTKILCEDNGVVLCTLGAGIFYYDRATQTTSHYSYENKQLPSNYCYNVCNTHDGNILITTDKGVTYYNPRINKFSTVNFKHYFPNTHIIRNCGLFSDNEGTVFVGSTKGLVTFKEEEFHRMKESQKIPNFYFSGLTVDDREIKSNDQSGLLEYSMPFTESIRLGHAQNNLKVNFAISDYEQNLTGVSFKYKMEGLNNNWIKTEERYVLYNNLQSGSYTLYVTLMSYDKELDEIRLKIHVASPWYNTWWAWIIYIVVIGLLTNILVKNRIAKRTLSLKLENERNEKERIEQLNHEKLVFFTNVSHEFRTPLTLLISHVDILLQKHSFSPTIYNQILKIRKNAEQMNNLISELLEFRKLTQNHMKLQISQSDLSAFVKESYLPFVDYANQRNITYENHFTMEPVVCAFDERLLNKVIFNLLSNAFKFTPDGGSITILGKTTPDEVSIIVKDTGVGLSEKDVSQIFVRFYQGDNQQKNNVQSPGTGIGLALCRAIVERHHGQITVKSEVGLGSEFTVRLKRSLDVFRNDDQVDFIDVSHEKSYVIDSLPMVDEQPPVIEEETEGQQSSLKEHTVLLVEDNVELLQILKDLFAPLYQVFTATNGEEGLKMVYEQKVDLIISDIMMPKMSGTEMCLQLKNNIDYCHIPIILLTALDSTEQNIEGLSRGADDYITKPFHAGLLLARANNLIRSRLLMQHQFDKRPMSEIDLTSINPLDQELLKKVNDIIQEHIDDPLFDIPLLCQELGVSRSLIYAKFKALTGMTPNNFILNFRLKFAATLLKQYKTMPISEVSDRSGFNSPVYFSQCFKKQFGTTPHNYKKENGN